MAYLSNSRARIIAVDDDESVLSLIESECGASGHEITLVRNSQNALASIRANKPDIVILDLVMRDHCGAELCERIRSNAFMRSIWIIVISKKNAESDIVRCLDAGADDFLTKPFGVRELNARIRSYLRRRNQWLANDASLDPGLVVDRDQHSVQLAGSPIKLTPAQFQLLAYFTENPGRVFSRETLLTLISGSRSESCPRTIDTHVKSLRHKLREQRSQLETVRGVGYRWNESP